MQDIPVLFGQPTKCIFADAPEITPWSTGWEPPAYLIMGAPRGTQKIYMTFQDIYDINTKNE